MNKLIAFVTLCFAVSFANAQNATIKGVITDTLNKQNLTNATVSVLQTKDSVLIKFARSDKEGKFELNKLPAGKHLLMITYPGFADYFEEVDLSQTPQLDRGMVKMTLKSRLLEDVLVRTKIAAIRMKGDTIEYKADSFKVSAGASVEEMLRKLPGLQVDKDGNITAQGEKVEKVLVDGEEFFGDDPTMATKNLQADAIDKVQVFDKKSDQAAFTGIDDGKKTKTLNLTLKEDKKKGYFGKAEFKGGVGNRWNNTLMANAFKSKRKLSAYGIMSSTGTTGLSWGDREKYGEGNNMEYNADEGYFYSFGSSDDFDNGNGTYSGEGIPKSYSAGINYGNKFNQDKQTVNGSYRYNKLINEGTSNYFTQTILPTKVLFNNESRNFHNNRERHSLNATVDVTLDSFTSVKVTTRGYKGNQASESSNLSQTVDGLNRMVNKSNRSNYSSGDNQNLNSSFILRHRFKKVGRTISLSVDQQYRKTNTIGFLNSEDNFFDSTTGAVIKSIVTDQKKINNNTLSAYNTRLAYTEPLLKNTFIELSYGLRVTQSESEKLSYNKAATGKYDVMDLQYSNHYNFDVLTNTGGMMLRYNTKKYSLAGGGDIGLANFRQTDLMKNTEKRYNYTNFFPRGNFQYKFNANARFSLNYNGNTRQPTIEQIQPVRDNSNTLNVAVGNPNLKQEFRHNFNLNYNFYKVLTQRGLYTYLSFNTVSNAISTSETVATSGDSVGKRTYQYINVNGNYSGYSGGGYNFKVKKLDLSLNFGYNLNMSHYNNIINNIKNSSNNRTYGLNFGIYKYKEKKYNFNYYSNVSYNTSVSSVKSNYKTSYYTHSHNLYLNVTLPAKLELNTSVQANFREKLTETDNNNNVVLLNGYFGRKLFKNDKAMIRIEGYDILNQNKGFSRYLNANTIRENTYETLSRYFLLSFVWNFSKNPAGATPGAK